MSDILRDRLVEEALPEIGESGFSQATLSAAAARAGISKREVQEAFPDGPASLVEAFSHWADRRMAETMASQPAEPHLRDRVAGAVRSRIEAIVPHKEAARRAAAFLAQPQHTVLAARLLMRTVDAMWRAAGDESTDFSYYTKRAMLGGVYAATLAYWFSDSSEGHCATWTFLGHRIENVMQIERFRSAAREAVSKLPDPFGILSSFRRGRDK